MNPIISPGGQFPSGSFFSTPDQVQDFAPPYHESSWSAYVSRIVDTKAAEGGVRFYNPTRIVPTAQPALAEISWSIFPQRLMGLTDEARWAEADRNFPRRDTQDEYCEWSVERNAEGKLIKVVFTCEMPEYWDHIAKNPNTLLSLYRQLNPGCPIEISDLYENGRYNPQNRWNKGTQTGHIVHMLHKDNKLDDAVELVAKATILRHDDENGFITDGPELVRIAGYTSWRRCSDPHIAQEVNKLARLGKMVTLCNPIGVYFERFFGQGKFRTEHREEIPWFWTFSRGQGDRFSRVVFEVPPEAGFVLGDIYDRKSGRKLQYGAQLADHLRVKVAAQAIPFFPKIFSPLWSFIPGRNNKHTPLTPAFISSSITDYFGQCLARVPIDRHPITLRAVIDKLPSFTWVPFMVHEGLHIKNAGLEKRPRLIIIATPNHPTPKPSHTAHGCRIGDISFLRNQVFKVDTLCIVGSGQLDREDVFLQCAGFDPNKGYFNFYERAMAPLDGTNKPGWLYFGCSKDAFEPDSQRKGIFCGHVNGALVMKELERPWLHWHSSMSPDLVNCLNPNNPFLNEEIMHAVAKADDLELIIIEGVRKWFDKRRDLDFGLPPQREVKNVYRWISHVLLTTTINIGASIVDTRSVVEEDNDFPPPKGLFYNEDCLDMVLGGLSKAVPQVKPIRAALYKKGIEKQHLFILEDIKASKISDYNEGQAPMTIMTPSREDTEGVRTIIDMGLLPKQHVAAMLMVDFCNPVYSSRRAELMKYIPDTALCLGHKNYDLEGTILQNINKSSQKDIPGSAEAEYLKWLKSDNTAMIETICTYIQQVDRRLQTQEGVDDILRLAESRRRIFRPPPGSQEPRSGLAEFDMSIPYAMSLDWDARRVIMKGPGEVEEMTGPPHELTTNISSPGSRFGAGGCPFAAR